VEALSYFGFKMLVALLSRDFKLSCNHNFVNSACFSSLNNMAVLLHFTALFFKKNVGCHV
jgi:hypothetical protein